MYLDNDLQFSDAQEFTSASVASTDYVDSLANGDAVSPGSRLKVAVPVAFALASGAPTLVVSLQSDSDDGFATDLTTHFSSASFLTAALVAGKNLIDIQLPPDMLRYIRVYYTLGGTGTFNAGKIDANIVLDTNRTMDRPL